MFDFEKLGVYTKAKTFNSHVRSLLRDKATSLDRNEQSQLRRAAFSVMLNIAEGSGRFGPRDKRNFYVIARGSVFECVSIFDFMKDEKILPVDDFNNFYSECEEISKMLYSMIRKLE